MNTDRAIAQYRRARATVKKARDAANAYRGAFDDEASRRLRLAVAEAEIVEHDAALALDAEDEAIAELDAVAQKGAAELAATKMPTHVPHLESYAASAVTAHAAAIAATLPKAADREAAEQQFFATWSAVRSAIKLHNAERRARDLPPARWHVPASPNDWRELLDPRPAPPVSSSVKIAADLRRELNPPSECTDRRTRGVQRGDLEDARERAG
jgi:hypothetical protein